MKPDHRHELKTNELAEWVSNFPRWAKENRTTIICVLALIVAAAAFYIWRFHSKNVVVREQLQFTNLVNQLLRGKMQILSAQAQGKDLSFILLQPANSLNIFAQNTSNDQMAAFALIKRAETLRAELHYRLGTVNKQDLTAQINLAKASYTEAVEKSSSNPSLMASAKFGLGLCEEELSNFEKAEQIYRDIAENPDFEGTIAVAAAKHRLDTMADYKSQIVFKASPKPRPIDALQPPIQLKPADTNQIPPTPDILSELPDINLGPETPNILSEVPDINLGAEMPNNLSEVPDTNLPGR